MRTSNGILRQVELLEEEIKNLLHQIESLREEIAWLRDPKTIRVMYEELE